MNNRADIATGDGAAASLGSRAILQLNLFQILAVWAAAALPMGALSWILAPLVATQLSGPGALVRALLVTMTIGLVWQGLLVALLVRREQGTLDLPAVRHALWLRSPVSPRTGRRGGRTWLVLIPLILLFAAAEFTPGFAPPGGRDLAAFIDSTTGHEMLSGGWGWFALIVVLTVFNTVLGEELLFRGYLLPRMEATFGRGDWLANGVLFATYHLHMPWTIPVALIDTLAISFPSKRYRSAMIGILVHSSQSLVLLGATLSLVLQ